MQQAQADMILSVNEKQALLRRQQEMEQYENEMVRRYAEQQQQRLNQIQAAKDAVEAEKDGIFKKLEVEENQRRAEKEFQENLRNELNYEEQELAAQQRDHNELVKREQQKFELQEAAAYQAMLKHERAIEEKRIEAEFKQKLLQKFAEDERLEQMNA